MLNISGVESWAALSQLVHEACEEAGVPNLPAHGIMHIVLNVYGRPIPVTASTKLSQLRRAKALRVSIGDNAKGERAVGKRAARTKGESEYGSLPRGDGQNLE
eukprot:6199654-Pleurochrysis_carterae.AAC.8